MKMKSSVIILFLLSLVTPLLTLKSIVKLPSTILNSIPLTLLNSIDDALSPPGVTHPKTLYNWLSSYTTPGDAQILSHPTDIRIRRTYFIAKKLINSLSHQRDQLNTIHQSRQVHQPNTFKKLSRKTSNVQNMRLATPQSSFFRDIRDFLRNPYPARVTKQFFPTSFFIFDNCVVPPLFYPIMFADKLLTRGEIYRLANLKPKNCLSWTYKWMQERRGQMQKAVGNVLLGWSIQWGGHTRPTLAWSGISPKKDKTCRLVRKTLSHTGTNLIDGIRYQKHQKLASLALLIIIPD